MSVSMYQSQVERIEKDINTIEKKILDYENQTARHESAILKYETNMMNSKNESSIKSCIRSIESERQKKIRIETSKRNESKKKIQKSTELITAKRRLQTAQANELKNSNQKISESVFPRLITPRTDNTYNGDRQINNINAQSNNILYDVFVSHASEDKENFVKPLVMALKDNGINAWYDKHEIGWGDSFSSSINRGLVKSRYAIVVLSPYSMHKYWTNTELDTILSMESVNAQKLLPIFHNISYEEIIAQKPIISGRLGINSNEGIEYIVEQMKKQLENIDKEHTNPNVVNYNNLDNNLALQTHGGGTINISNLGALQNVTNNEKKITSKHNQIDIKKQKIKNLIVSSLDSGYKKTYDDEIERIEQERIEELERIEQEQERIEQERLSNSPFGFQKKLTPISAHNFNTVTIVHGEKANSLRLKAWNNIRASISEESNSVEKLCIHNILLDIEFYINTSNRDEFVSVTGENNNLEGLQTHVNKYIDDFNEGIYDCIIIAKMKNKLFVE